MMRLSAALMPSTGWLVLLLMSLVLRTPANASDQGVRFVDVTEPSRLDFHHTHGGDPDHPKRYYIETMCGGVAFIDYDDDGFLDAYAVNGQYLSDPTRSRAVNRLFRNLGDGSFSDQTVATGAGDEGYGMGITAGDVEGDGDVDLYITNYGPNALLLNGASHFEHAERSLGVADSAWGVGAAFLDYDNDGDLDLYVANYLEYSLSDADRKLRAYGRHGTDASPAAGYPHPDNFPGAADILYRNDGDRFTDVTHASGVYEPTGKGMGIAIADYDDDGDVDIFVANDQTENFLYQNGADGTFSQVGLLSGTAYDRDGRLQSGMGAGFGDYDNDGQVDLALTVYQGETNALFRNEGGGFFTDVAFREGLAIPSLPYVSWGVGFLDYDNDGFRDLFVANGHVLDNAHEFDSAARFAEPNQLFRNLGPDEAGRWRFADVSMAVGEGMTQARPSRGVAFGDYDNDGDPDLLILNLNEAATLLRNDGGNANHWLSVQLRGTRSNRDGIGARVRVVAGETILVDQMVTGGSYLSQHQPRLAFGLGSKQVIDSVRVQWPSGIVDEIQRIPVDHNITIVEGAGLSDAAGR